MSNCGSLTADINKACATQITEGNEADILLILKSDWDVAVAEESISFDATSENLIDAIVLAVGKEGFIIETNEGQIKPKIETVIKNGAHLWKQTVEFAVPLLDAATEKAVNDLNEQRVVAIYKNKFHGTDGETKYKVLGVDSGLKVATATLEGNAEFAGWIITLANEDDGLEMHNQYSLYKTSEVVTDAIYTALQTPTPAS